MKRVRIAAKLLVIGGLLLASQGAANGPPCEQQCIIAAQEFFRACFATTHDLQQCQAEARGVYDTCDAMCP